MYTVKKWSIQTIILIILILSILVFDPGFTAFARTSGGFSVHAVIPDNQIDKKQTYFDLRMKPEDEQDIEIVITNSRDELLTAEVRLNAASTGRNGLIVYTNSQASDDIAPFTVNDVAALQTQTVTVPAHSSKNVTIRIKMPKESFDGVILGGITVEGNDPDDGDQVVRGVSLKNNIMYVLALKMTENDNEVPPDFDLLSVKPELINYRPAVVATLGNKSARIVKNMEVEASVYQKGSDSVLHDMRVDTAEMAPSSKGAFVIDWNDEALKAGTYRLRMTAVYEGRTWEWDEEFTIAGEAGELNNAAIGLKKDRLWLYWSLGLLALVIVGILAFLLGRHRKDREQ